MTLMEIISKNLERMLKEREMSIRLLSKNSGVSENTIRNILKCKIKTTNTRIIIKLARVLNVKIDDFLYDSEYEIKKK